MRKILVSACLLGNPVRYDGRSKLLPGVILQDLQLQNRIICYCPEVGGGLPVPRPAAEIFMGDGSDVLDLRARVKTRSGSDVSEAFIAGAQQALSLCQQHDIRIAILTASSPSCGSRQIYDGSFNHRLRDGDGVTAALLKRNGIAVFDQHQVQQAVRQLESESSKVTPQSGR